ncbi:MAG: hypothetical protein GYB25_14730 [Rhodobacteraceae bacterium]|nr:hypothetical protein [Paracoccaceae bacterium]
MKRGHGGSGERAERHRRDQGVFHELLRRHDVIRRSVEEIEGGIRAVTESDDPEVAAMIRDHAGEMHRRMEEGFGLRHWDPAFAEIFAQKDKVRMVIEATDKGVVVEETSEDANVAVLIRAHGAVVSAFVREGGRAAAQESPLPPEYRRVLG